MLKWARSPQTADSSTQPHGPSTTNIALSEIEVQKDVVVFNDVGTYSGLDHKRPPSVPESAV